MAGPARRRLLELLGLTLRAGGIVAGTDAVRRAARDGQAYRVLLAGDAAAGQTGKLLPLLEARGVPHHVLFTRDELGAALGRGAVAAVGITHQDLARRAGELVAALPAESPMPSWGGGLPRD